MFPPKDWITMIEGHHISVLRSIHNQALHVMIYCGEPEHASSPGKS
jgi:hypothetical protein